MQENSGSQKSGVSSRAQRRTNGVQGNKGHKSLHRSESFWRGLFQEFDGSFLKVKAFCAQKGVATSTFHYWRRKLQLEKKRRDFQEVPLFIPVKVSSNPIPQNKMMSLDAQMREKIKAFQDIPHGTDGEPRNVPLRGPSFPVAFVLCVGPDMRLEIPSAFETKDLQRLIVSVS